MNDAEWEYILLHNLPKEWVPMTGEKSDEVQGSETAAAADKEDKEPNSSAESGKQEASAGDGSKESTKLNGHSGEKSPDADSGANGGEKSAHGSGPGNETVPGGREHSGASGNSPREPTRVPTGDAGKNSDGSWKTRTSERKSFGFQKRLRERKRAEGSKG